MPTLEAAPVHELAPKGSLGIGADLVYSYVGFGNVRPTAEYLGEYRERMLRRSPRKMGLSGRLVLADMCLDLAVADPEQAGYMTEEASEQLARVVTLGQETLASGSSNEIDRVGRSAIVAHCRLAEMPNWRRVVIGQRPVVEYENMLKAAFESYRFFRGTNHQTKGKISEFIPILLGARAEARGWAGRLALTREDNGADQTPTQNRNWDVGITTEMSRLSFLRPTLRVNVKGHRFSEESSLRYFNGGVTELIADECGFGNPAAIIKGCLFEDRISAPETPGIYVRKYCSFKLDDITARIHSQLFETQDLAQSA